MLLVTEINVKNAKPYSNIDFASNTKNAIDVNINCAQQIKKIVSIELVERCFLLGRDGWDKWMPMIWWQFWTNWNSLIEPAILINDIKLISHRPFELYLLRLKEKLPIHYQTFNWNQSFRHNVVIILRYPIVSFYGFFP